MDLGLNETQQMLKSSARAVFSTECPPSLVRAMEEDARGYSDELWRKMADLGWLGLSFPEEYGGAGSDFLDLSVLLEEMGQALVPGPFFSTVLGGLTLLDAANEDVKGDLLPKISQGQLLLTLALTEPSGTYDPQGIETQADHQGEEYVIKGTKLFVPEANVADLMIVAARTASNADPKEGLTLFLVPRNSSGVAVTPQATLASDKQCEVEFQDVRVSSTSIVGGVGEGWPILERTLERAAVAKCMEMLGGAEAVLEMTLEYTKQRVQFGRPIGSFQAVQHHCANMAIDVQGCRYIAYQAAWKVAEGLPAAREVSMAKAWVSDAYQRVCALANLCHGAISFTKEHDLQLYTRRARVQEQAFGDASFHLRLLAQT